MAEEPAADVAEETPAADPPLSDNRRRAQRTAPLFAELATLETRLTLRMGAMFMASTSLLALIRFVS